MPISTPPTAPTRQDPASFNSRADTFLTWLAGLFVTELNSTQTAINASESNAGAQAAAAAVSAATAGTQATSAAAQAAAAAVNAQAAAAAAGATAWVSGTTYAVGDVRWSALTNLTYRRLTAGAGTTDPSADTVNWSPAVAPGAALYLALTAF